MTAAALRSTLSDGRSRPVVSAYDALTARTAEAAGFEILHVTGFGSAAALTGGPDIGLVTAVMLCCWIPESGFIGNRQAASLLGLGPLSKDSGERQGERRTSGGRKRPRDTVYMAALNAARHNPDLAALCERRKAKGTKTQAFPSCVS